MNTRIAIENLRSFLKQYFCWTLTVVFLMAASCNKKCENKPHFLTQRQLNFVNFKKGSYWIMRDSVTGVRDSIVLDSVFQGMNRAPGIPDDVCGDFYETKKITFKGYLDSNDITCYIKATDNSLYMHLPRCSATAQITFGQFPKTYIQNGITYNEAYYSHYFEDSFMATDTESVTVMVNTESLFIKLKYYNAYRSRNLEFERAHIVR